MKKLIPVYLIIAVFLALSACDSNPWMEQLLEPKTITFDISGGSPVPSQTVYRGQKIVEPQPTMDGWEFDGWYTNKAGEGDTWDFDTIPEGDMTLYGFWTNDDKRYKPIAFDSPFKTVIYGAPPNTFTIMPGNYGGGVITYDSSHPEVATVDKESGEVTIKKAGTIVITATIPKWEIYPASSASYTLIVEPKEIKFNVPANFTLIPFDSDESTPSAGTPTCGTTISVTAIQSDVVNGDNITITLGSNSYGLRLEGDAPITIGSSNGTVTLKYNDATVVNPKVTVPLTISNNSNYTIAPIDVTIMDGRTSDRPIPVKQENIKAFNKYANEDGLSRHYEQVENINIPPSSSSGSDPASNWTAIGSITDDTPKPFTGSFDGGGNTITGLTINTGEPHQGMFGYIERGEIRNIRLVNCNIKGGAQTGGLAGHSSGTVENCSVTLENGSTGKVEGTSNVGGVVGYNIGTVQSCYTTVNVLGDYSTVGGVVGVNNGTVQYCYATGSVSGLNQVGGVVGTNNDKVRNCVALNTSLTVNNTSETPDQYGRVVGQNNGTIGLVNNYGNSNMQGPNAASPPNWTSSKNSKNGESVDPNTYSKKVWWTNKENWDNDSWDEGIWTWGVNDNGPPTLL